MILKQLIFKLISFYISKQLCPSQHKNYIFKKVIFTISKMDGDLHDYICKHVTLFCVLRTIKQGQLSHFNFC